MQSPFQAILTKYRKISLYEKEKVDRFERLMKSYLLTDPKYAQLQECLAEGRVSQ